MRTSLSSPAIPPLRWLFVFLIWAAMWVLMELSVLNLLVLPVMLFLAFNVWQSKSPRPAFALAASPLPVLFSVGVLSWFGERPCFVGAGLPGPTFYNLNPQWRTYNCTTGCLIDGGELLRHGPRNGGLALMCRLFGPPPKTYHGDYPGKAEAVAITTEAPLVSLDEFEKGKVRVGSEDFDLRGQTQLMARDVFYFSWNHLLPEDKPLEVRAASLRDCLLIRVTNRNHGVEAIDHIYVMDRAQPWPFARYVLSDTRGSSPPYFATRSVTSPDASGSGR